jgi:hypothetical protein
VHTQDPISIEGLLREPDSAETPAGAQAPELKVERRRAARPAAVQHEQSRILGRMLECAFLGGLAASAALIGFYFIKGTLEGPLTEVQKALIG